MTTTQHHPGLMIRATRRAAGLTVGELAAAAGAGRGYLSDVERGRRMPSNYWLHHLSRVLADAIPGSLPR